MIQILKTPKNDMPQHVSLYMCTMACHACNFATLELACLIGIPHREPAPSQRWSKLPHYHSLHTSQVNSVV